MFLFIETAIAPAAPEIRIPMKRLTNMAIAEPISIPMIAIAAASPVLVTGGFTLLARTVCPRVVALATPNPPSSPTPTIAVRPKLVPV